METAVVLRVRTLLGGVGIFLWLGVVALPLYRWLSGPMDVRNPAVLAALRFTVFQAAVSAIFSWVIGTSLGLWAGRQGSHQIAFLKTASWTCWLATSIPAVLLASVVLAMLHGSSWAFSPAAVIVAHVFLNAPWICIHVMNSRAEMPDSLVELAQTAGVTRFQIWKWIEWPHVKHASWIAAAQSFSFCTMSFFLVLNLGGGPPAESLETLIYSSVRVGMGQGPQWKIARASAAWQLLIGSAPWIWIAWKERKPARMLGRGRGTETHPGAHREKKKAPRWILPAVFLGPVLATCFVQWLVLFPSHTPPHAWSSLGGSLRDSALLGGMTCLLTLVWAATILCEKSRLFSHVIRATLAVSPVVLAIAWDGNSRWPLAVQVAVIQAAIFLPMILGILSAALDRIPIHQVEVARTCGAGPVRSWMWVDARRMSRIALGLCVVVFFFAAMESSVTSYYGSLEWRPLSVWVAEQWGRFRFDWASWVLASMVLSAAAVAAMVGVVSGKRAKI